MRRNPSIGRVKRPPRHVLRIPCQVVRQRDFRLIADRLENFSLTGLLVSPAEAVLTGEPVLVSFRFPSSGAWLDAEAVVSRVIHGRRPGEWARCLGLELDDLDGMIRALLGKQVGRTPPVPPRARPGRRQLGLSWGMLRRLGASSTLPC